jgi:undecaprenyl-diphosphatase
MDLIQALILSAVEGFTEFLPVSSTGHLILTAQILEITQTEFVKSFVIIIQLGAILAVVILYWKMLINKKNWPQILVAFIPSAIIGFILYKFIKEVLIGNSLITILALFIGGIAFIAIELWRKNKKQNEIEISQISYKNAFIIGLFQSIAVIPGVSRSGSTILGGLILGINRKTAAEFSFILAVPTIFAATILDIIETQLSYNTNEIIILIIGFIASFIFAFISINWLIKYLQNHTFIAFGVYRIILAIVFYILFLR